MENFFFALENMVWVRGGGGADALSLEACNILGYYYHSESIYVKDNYYESSFILDDLRWIISI